MDEQRRYLWDVDATNMSKALTPRSKRSMTTLRGDSTLHWRR